MITIIDLSKSTDVQNFSQTEVIIIAAAAESIIIDKESIIYKE